MSQTLRILNYNKHYVTSPVQTDLHSITNIFVFVNVPLQGIMCRYSDKPDRGRWQLCIEKSVVQVQALNAGIVSMQHGVQSDTSHILQTIALKTQGGGYSCVLG